MSTSTSSPPTAPVTIVRSPSLHSGSLPRWAPWVLLGVSVVVVFAIFAMLAGAADTSLNIAGWLVTSAIVYLVFVYVISMIVEGRRRAFDRFITGLVASAFLIALTPLVSLAATVIMNGLSRFDVQFFTWSMRNVTGEGGGQLHAIIGTLLVTLGAAVISIPIGLLTAIYLVEYGRGRMAQGVTFLVDVMTGIPSIVAGLFAYALFVIFLGPGAASGIMGSIALSVLMIPVVVRSSEEMLRLVPNELREASYALGVPKWRTVAKIVLPTSLAGITTGVMLAIARVIGETAPLLLTAGYTASMNWNLFAGQMATLPVFTYDQFANPGIPKEAYIDRAWASALTLILLVMAMNLIARLISRIYSPKTGR